MCIRDRLREAALMIEVPSGTEILTPLIFAEIVLVELTAGVPWSISFKLLTNLSSHLGNTLL